MNPAESSRSRSTLDDCLSSLSDVRRIAERDPRAPIKWLIGVLHAAVNHRFLVETEEAFTLRLNSRRKWLHHLTECFERDGEVDEKVLIANAGEAWYELSRDPYQASLSRSFEALAVDPLRNVNAYARTVAMAIGSLFNADSADCTPFPGEIALQILRDLTTEPF